MQINPGKSFDVDFVLAEMVQLNLLAVADHARSMTVLAVRPKLGPSSATVTRGAVESLARIRWVSSGTTENECRLRALVVLHADVNDAAFATQFIGADREIDREEYLAVVTAQIKTFDLARPKWRLRRAVREAVDEAWRSARLDDWTPYSQLSAAAHGMQPALGALLTTGGSSCRARRSSTTSASPTGSPIARCATCRTVRCCSWQREPSNGRGSNRRGG